MDQSKNTTIMILLAVLLVAVVVIFNVLSGKKESSTSILENAAKPAEEVTAYIASGHPEWPPIMWKSGDQIIGVGPELLQLIANDLGIKIVSSYTGLWDEVQAKAKSGTVDLLVAAYKTQEREAYMDYSIPYTVDPIALFVKKGKALKYSQWSDLAGKRGVATVGDSYGQKFDDYIKSKLSVQRVKTATEAFDLVGKGKADYFIYALYSGEKAIIAGKMQGKFAPLEKYVAEENFYITISKKSQLAPQLPEINKLIEKYKNDGTIEKLIEANKLKMESGS
jgi:polar amino acid transport system substrate-binding protein